MTIPNRAAANPILTTLAKEHLGFETLEVRHVGDLDFREVGVSAVRAALEAAYAAGRASVTEQPLRRRG